ncbi:vacuolar protein sorting/targeting protein PEP1, partial [Coniosporium uncinatum]
MAICKENPLAVEYYDPTGYRKIPISTCQGGQEFELTAPSHPCPGHEPEYERKHGVSGVALFFAIVLPIAAAAGVGYWVWRNWEGKFGQIRLGDGMGGGAFDGNSPLVKWPVAVLSGIVAVLAAVPLVVGSLWKAVMGRFGGGSGGVGGRGYAGRTYR